MWAVVRSWRRAHQQFKGTFLIWSGLPVFVLYFVLSVNKAANPNWDGLAFLSLGILAASYWREKLESRPNMRRWAGVALALGLLMSLPALNSDLLRAAGFEFPRRDPADRMRGWETAANAVEKMRGEIEAQLGDRVFMITDGRDRASEFAFYFRDKRQEGAGHPPVYIIESQAIVNQFSFWPRYDEFVAAPAGRGTTDAGEGDAYTEEDGVNLFQGRNAMYVQANDNTAPNRRIRAAFESVDHHATIEVARYGKVIRTLQVFVCKNYRTLPL